MLTSQVNNGSKSSTIRKFADPMKVLALDSMANICVMPEDIAEKFVTQHGWTIRKLNRPVHMGAVSHDNTIVLSDIIVNPHNQYLQPFYIAPRGTMTICTTDYISRLGLYFVILPHQAGFVIRHPRGTILYQGKVAPDLFHYIDFDTFNALRPVGSARAHDGIPQSDMEDYISEVCHHLDIIDTERDDLISTVNNTRRNNHIPAEIVRVIREGHVRYGHMSPRELAKVIASGARSDMPIYTSDQVLKVMTRWPCIYCKAATARIGSKGIGSGVKLQVVGEVFSVDNKDGYVPCLHFGFTGYHLFADYANDYLFAVGHKNHDAFHLGASIKALNTECNSYGHIIKEVISDAGSVERSAEVKLECSKMAFAILPLPTDMQYLNYVERSVQTIDDKISPAIATARAGCTLGDELWYSALQNALLSHNCGIHPGRIVTRYEEFYGNAPNMDALFTFRLGQFVTVTQPVTKGTKTDHAMRGPVCVALHGVREKGTWVWSPNRRKAFLRGHLYITPVDYVGIPNQSMMVEEDAVPSKGGITYPHSSIVKFIERHVEMDHAVADKMETTLKVDSAVPVVLPEVISFVTTNADPIVIKDSVLASSTDVAYVPVDSLSTESINIPSEDANAAASQPISTMDVEVKGDLMGDALIGVRVRKRFRKKGQRGRGKFYSGTVTTYFDSIYGVDYDDGDYEEYSLDELRDIQIMSTNTTIAEEGSESIDVTRSEFPVQVAYKEDKALWEPIVKKLLCTAVDVTKSMRPCSRGKVPPDALLLPASVVCRVKADPKQMGHHLLCKGRIVVQHSVKRFPPLTDHGDVHATVATAKNVKTIVDLSAHTGKPHQQGDIETAFPKTPLWPSLIGKIFLEMPKCLGLPEGMVFEMLTFMEGFQLSNGAFDERLSEGLSAFNFRYCPNDSQLFCINTPEGDFLVGVKIVDNLMFVSTSDVLKDLLFEAVRSVGYNIVDEATDKFLGTQLDRKADGSLHMHQEYHAKKLLAKYNISGDSAPTPLSSSFTTEDYIESGMSLAIPIKHFQSILGDVIWLTITRYDIQHAMSALSQKTHYCSQRDYDEVLHVLRYILADPGKSLIFHRAPTNEQPASLRDVLDMPMFIMGSSDSAHRSSGRSAAPRDQTSTFVRLGSPHNAAIYVSSKVSGPTLSACEAENNATIAVMKEVLDTYLVLNWIGFRNISQIIVEGDNTSNIAMCTTTTSNARKKSRYFAGNAQWIKQFSDRQLVRIVHTPGPDLASNALTKRVTEEEQVWSSEDMRGAIRRYSQIDAMPHIPIMKSDHERMWPLIPCSATADYDK